MFVPLLITDFIRRASRHYGRKVGVVDGEKRFSYAEFNERANRLSNALVALGIEKGDRVAVIDSNSHRYLEQYYGVPQMGAILLPINIRLSARDIQYVLNDAEARCLLINQDMLDLIDRSELPYLEKVILMRDDPAKQSTDIDAPEYEELLAGSVPVIEQDFDLDENDPAEMFYTSGTTSRPKGMLQTHRMVYLSALKDLVPGADVPGISDKAVNLQCVPLFHANAWRKAHNVTVVGGRNVMVHQFRPEVICRLIQDERVTHMEIVPTMADMLTSYEDVDKYDLSSLEWLAVGGAAMSQGTQEALIRIFPNAVVFGGWGMSETTSTGTLAIIKEYLENLPEEEKRRLRRSQGIEDYITRIRVVDAEGNDVEPDGKHAGEIIVRGNQVIDSYWKLPEVTAETIINGWLHSGDVATIDENGYIQIVDRLKDLIISGGENIGSIEIEDAVCSHPAVQEAAVVAAPHDKWGETPAAVVVVKEGCSLTEEELIEHCRTCLAGFKVPRIIQFRDKLPKGGTGKILKSAIKDEFWQGRDKKVMG